MLDFSVCAHAGGTLCSEKLRSDYKNNASLKRPFCVRVQRSSANGHLAHISLLVSTGLCALTLVEAHTLRHTHPAHTLQRFARRPVLAHRKSTARAVGPLVTARNSSNLQ